MNFFAARSYLNYWLRCVDDHSLHSPFLFDFYQQVIKSSAAPSTTLQLMNSREHFRRNQDLIHADSLGAPSKISPQQVRSIKSIANGGITSHHFSKILYRLGKWMGSRVVIELGTSIGLTTLYLASIPKSRVYTFEGNPELAKIASNLHLAHKSDNIEIIRGNIDLKLPDYIEQKREGIERLMVFFDAHHEFDPMTSYFEECLKAADETSVFVFDDIHWSPEMNRFWNYIAEHVMTTVTIDLFQFGIAFFDPGLPSQRFILKHA